MRKKNNNPENYVYNILARKDFTEGEIRLKLGEKFNISDERIDSIVSKLKSYGLVNDERFKKNFVLSKLRDGYGPYYISQKLYDKRLTISPDDISDIASCEDISIEETAKNVCIKKLDSIITKSGIGQKTKHLSGYDLYKKCFDFLVRRGFDMELSRRIAKEETQYESNFS